MIGSRLPVENINKKETMEFARLGEMPEIILKSGPINWRIDKFRNSYTVSMPREKIVMTISKSCGLRRAADQTGNS